MSSDAVGLRKGDGKGLLIKEEREKRRKMREKKVGVVSAEQQMGLKKREREREGKEEDGGLMPADAVEVLLHSFHCVMAASSSIGQSQYSSPWLDRPLQAEREKKNVANRVCCWTVKKKKKCLHMHTQSVNYALSCFHL